MVILSHILHLTLTSYILSYLILHTNPLGNYLTTQSNPDGVDYQDLTIYQVCSSSAPTFLMLHTTTLL